MAGHLRRICHSQTEKNTYTWPWFPSWLSLRSFLDWFTVILSEGQEELTVWKPPACTAYKSEALLANNKTNMYAERKQIVTRSHPLTEFKRKEKQNTNKKRATTKLIASTGCALGSPAARRRQIFCMVAQMFSINPEFPIALVALVPPPARCE